MQPQGEMPVADLGEEAGGALVWVKKKISQKDPAKEFSTQASI